MKGTLIWACLGAVSVATLFLAAQSELLAWRSPIYIAAGFAGILAMLLLVVQPLLAANLLPPLTAQRGRHLHRWMGGAIVTAVLFHITGLWVTSPPDVVDALLLRSPTPFSIWGVIAMWALFMTALIARVRRSLRPRTWKRCHGLMAVLIATGTILHAILIEGTMETVSKLLVCGALALTTGLALSRLKVWRPAAKQPR